MALLIEFAFIPADNNLSIPLYVRAVNGNGVGATEAVSLEETISNWQECSIALRESVDDMMKVLEGVDSRLDLH